MTYFSHIRAGLMASALLLTTALASPALAETLPEISPRQIASDVKIEYHPETGVREYVAPSFDPFEEDRNMAGTASLRSVSNAMTIDGQSVRGGALLDMTFYYNSASNDPYDTRGYEEAVYLSGEFAPVTRRDNRILECNEQVQDVVYYHEDYYRPSLYVNLFRPYRHYRGHFGYGRGYGYDYARSYRGYSGYRGYRGNRNYRRGYDGDRRRTHNRRNVRDRVTDRGVNDARRTDREERRRDRADSSTTRRNQDRTSSTRRLTREERRANRNGDNRETRRNNRDGRRGNTSRSDSARTATPRANRALRMERVVTNENAPRIRNNNDRATSRRGVTNASAPRRVTPARAATPTPRAERAAPAPRRERAERSRPARTERAVNRARETKSRNAPRRSNGRKGNSKLRLMGFMPMASAWSRNVVRNVDVQCAREEILSIHIPQQRLDAARFDGLTVLVLDRTGQEIPVFVPPNYIEGFRQAVNARVTPNVSYQDPVNSAPATREPAYQEPRPYGVQEAPCPVGTTKQNDGTCLQGGVTPYGGYPTR